MGTKSFHRERIQTHNKELPLKLKELAGEYENGKIAKQDYIKKMHEIHRVLFEYPEYIQNTDIKSIEITDGSVVMTTREHGVKLYTDFDDIRIVPIEIINFKAYEKQELYMIDRILADRGTFFDIGANIGWYTINIAKMKQRVTVYAFEPIPKTFECLKKNIALNNLTNASLYNFGFSDKSDALTFYYYPEGSGNASMVNVSNQENIEEIKCKVLRIDDFVQDQDFAVDFIKCDVEGAELHVFQGGAKTIAEHKPIVFAEMLRKWSAKFDYHPNDIISFFRDMEYCCFTVSNGGLLEFLLMNENTEETNFFFLHREKHAKQIEALHI